VIIDIIFAFSSLIDSRMFESQNWQLTIVESRIWSSLKIDVRRVQIYNETDWNDYQFWIFQTHIYFIELWKIYHCDEELKHFILSLIYRVKITNKFRQLLIHFFSFFLNLVEIIENYAIWILRCLNEHFKYNSNVSWRFDENHARSVWRFFSILIDERHIKFI
jgi:hypothetical protein